VGFCGRETEFKKAIALDPDDALTHSWYAENIGTIGGREPEALAEANRARQLDPLSDAYWEKEMYSLSIGGPLISIQSCTGPWCVGT
jgi:hypothetical protein